MTSPAKRLDELGFKLPPYQPSPLIHRVVLEGNVAYLSGHGPLADDGSLRYVGKVGHDISVEEGHEAARLVALSCLSSLQHYIGDLGQVAKFVKVLGFVNCLPEFSRHSEVINGFSDTIRDIFGDEIGKHARSAIGASSLPKDQAVEVEAIVRLK